ncbi:MAG: hypothetical protein DIZ80_04655 [endosymbiont of Galathealinum brachiosum]|uniref:TonB-dependent receptor n=1 Tax=endosymbiont of Galathealinum brachiosum TaxID=2200906 RepID=A0A370DIM1_9GAMM|nr:MAG: hypothetical protein DIZ80_04655 [endosymbiont of Galathealinum brachiosum]
MSKYLFILAILASVPAQADELDKYFTMSLQELMQVNITGSTRTVQSHVRVPSSVTTFTQEQVNRLGVDTLEQLQNYVPGFQSTRTADNVLFNATTTRGFSRGVLVLLDGQRLSSEFNTGIDVTTAHIPLEHIKRVEFVRGPGSSIYGANAFSAVINLISVDDVNKATLRAGEINKKATIQITSNESEFKYSGFLKGVDDKGETYTDPFNTLPNNTTETSDPFETVDLYLQAHYKDFSIYLSHTHHELEDYYSLNRLSNDNWRETDHSYLRLTYDFSSSENYHSQIAVSYLQSRDNLFGEVSPVTPPFTIDPLFAEGDIEEQTTAFEWFNTYNFDNDHSLQFGLEYRDADIKTATISYNYDIINFSSPFYNPDYYTFPLADESARQTYGIYTQYQGQIIDNLFLTLGIRYDEYSDVGSSSNPRTGLVYEFSDNTSVKFLYSTAFRAPSRNELDLQNNGILVGNPNLEPETIETFEAVLIKQFSNQTIQFSLFRNNIEDIIVSSSQPDGSIIRDNKDDARYEGIETEYNALFFKNLQTKFSYTNIFTSPDVSFRSSKQLASIILNHNRRLFNLNFDSYYHSEVENDFSGTRVKLSSYVVSNIKLSYSLQKNMKFYLQVKNLFDKEYFSPSGGSSFTVNVPNHGREGYLGIEYEF